MEKAEGSDLFEDQTHEAVATVLLGTICGDSNEGITIGLEGGWGSGKSTVVSILKAKVALKPDTFYFYFDAWSHEGDPLRRVFLESLIDQIEGPSDSLLQIRQRLSGRHKTSKTTSDQGATTLGKSLAVATFLVPLGVALVNATAKDLSPSLSLSLSPSWPFLISLLLACSPMIVLLANLLHVVLTLRPLNWKTAFANQHWRFLQNDTVKFESQEISEDPDRSSVEFETFFGKILEELIPDGSSRRLIFVVDNLDRVSPADALKIWSTLQTFLQNRNPGGARNERSKRIWVLVPYDPSGLRKVWDSRECTEGQRPSASFFDKSFQLRVEVPKPVMSGWESFCRSQIALAMPTWPEKDKEAIVDVLRWTRDSVVDAPTPRQIKTLINQIGLLRVSADESISTSSIALYAFLRYLKGTEKDSIEVSILAGTLPDSKYSRFFESGVVDDVCGLLYAVSPQKGIQILLEPRIDVAFRNRQQEEALRLMGLHGSAFWTVFDRHIGTVSDVGIICKYGFVIDSLTKKARDQSARVFARVAKTILSEKKSLEFPADSSTAEEVGATLHLIEVLTGPVSTLWQTLMKSLESKLREEKFNSQMARANLETIASTASPKGAASVRLSGIPLAQWMKWTLGRPADAFLFVVPEEKVIDDIGATIVAGAAPQPGILDLVRAIGPIGPVGLERLVEPLRVHVAYNNGVLAGASASVDSLELVQVLASHCPVPMTELLRSHEVYNLAISLGDQKQVATLLGRLLPSEMPTLQVPAVGNSATGLQQAKDFWKTSSKANASFVWATTKRLLSHSFLWKLVSDDTNKLAMEVIMLALSEGFTEVLPKKDAFSGFADAWALVGASGPGLEQLTRVFLDHTPLLEELVADCQVKDHPAKLTYLLELSQSKPLSAAMASALKLVTKEAWLKSLKEQDSLLRCAFAVKAAEKQFVLENDFMDALVDLLRDWLSGNGVPDASQVLLLERHGELLNKGFKTRTAKKIADLLATNQFTGNVGWINFIIKVGDFTDVRLRHQQTIQDCVERAITDTDTVLLATMDAVVVRLGDFVPASEYSEVLRNPVGRILSSDVDVEVKKAVKRIAAVFGIHDEANATEGTAGA
jgi:hypothetical protein